MTKLMARHSLANGHSCRISAWNLALDYDSAVPIDEGTILQHIKSPF